MNKIIIFDDSWSCAWLFADFIALLYFFAVAECISSSEVYARVWWCANDSLSLAIIGWDSRVCSAVPSFIEEVCRHDAHIPVSISPSNGNTMEIPTFIYSGWSGKHTFLRTFVIGLEIEAVEIVACLSRHSEWIAVLVEYARWFIERLAWVGV